MGPVAVVLDLQPFSHGECMCVCVLLTPWCAGGRVPTGPFCLTILLVIELGLIRALYVTSSAVPPSPPW